MRANPIAVRHQAMHKAAAMGQVACIRKLIEAKADFSAADTEGNTALHLAAQTGFGPVLAWCALGPVAWDFSQFS